MLTAANQFAVAEHPNSRGLGFALISTLTLCIRIITNVKIIRIISIITIVMLQGLGHHKEPA